jgi:hypothetical protein
LTKAQHDLRQGLEQLRSAVHNLNFWKVAGYLYHGPHDFVLQNGVWYDPRSLPRDIPRVRGLSFDNAIRLSATKGYRYVEGYALEKRIPLPFHHGWNLDHTGQVVDSTWGNDGRAYLGVEFNLGRADYAAWHDDATVLDNPANRNALFRHQWKGEDYTICWDESPEIHSLRVVQQAEKEGKIISIMAGRGA